MDYEKKYKNALTIAQSRFKIEKDESVLTCLGMMFPELRESEDERIRKELIDQLQYIIPEEGEYDEEGLVLPKYHERINRYRAYLEKQKEQKSAWMEKALEGEVMTNGFYPYEPRIVAPYPNCPYDFGDKVCVIVLPKED